jgi:hypothetical protein
MRKGLIVTLLGCLVAAGAALASAADGDTAPEPESPMLRVLASGLAAAFSASG